MLHLLYLSEAFKEYLEAIVLGLMYEMMNRYQLKISEWVPVLVKERPLIDFKYNI